MGAALSRNDSYQDGESASTGLPGIMKLAVQTYTGTPYTPFDNAFISIIVGAAFLSALSVLLIFCMYFLRPMKHLGDHTHIMALFGSLLLANLLQSVGTLMNTQWVLMGGVRSGDLCRVQGGVKQMGNVGSALWSFMISLHSFTLLFLRSNATRTGKWLTLVLGWAAVLTIILIGPFAIQTKEHGPYYGPSGFWCWITDEYPAAQTFLEYFFEWMSALLSFLLYTVVLLRVRGNIVRGTTGKWSLRWVPRGESWQLAIGRDYIDSSMARLAAIIVWYPVAYTVLIAPITIARFAGYAGAHIPQGFTFFADLIYGLGGFVNLLLLLITRRFLPDLNTLPDLSTPRARLDKGTPAAVGITPFVLPAPDLERQATGLSSPEFMQPAKLDIGRITEEKDVGDEKLMRRSVDSMGSMQSLESQESQAPLTGRR